MHRSIWALTPSISASGFIDEIPGFRVIIRHMCYMYPYVLHMIQIIVWGDDLIVCVGVTAQQSQQYIMRVTG